MDASPFCRALSQRDTTLPAVVFGLVLIIAGCALFVGFWCGRQSAGETPLRCATLALSEP